ncbi:MAG: copper chaperone PCu(A)C [Rhodospirillales bacterium]|nr:copper chaperone PCu(A)C [Rhodospirillales bacterium]
MTSIRFRFSSPAFVGLAAAVTLAIALLLSPSAARAHDGVHVEDPWARATLGGAKTGAGYVRIVNHSDKAERLVSATSPVAGRVELHEMATVNNVMQMRPLPRGIDIKGKETVELKPGGLHIMFLDLKQPLVAGKKVPLTLKFEREGEVTVEIEVRDMRGNAPAQGGHGQHKH